MGTEGHDARIHTLETELGAVRLRLHDKIIPLVQTHENRIGAVENLMKNQSSSTRGVFEHGKSVLIGLLMSACAYLIKNHGL